MSRGAEDRPCNRRTPARRGRSGSGSRAARPTRSQRLADPAAGELADDAGQLVELALQADERARRHHRRARSRAGTTTSPPTASCKTTCESLIDEIAAGGAARWAPRGVALLELVRPWLDRRPAEPVLLNYLGVALFGLNEAAARRRASCRPPSASTRASRTCAGNLAGRASARLKRPISRHAAARASARPSTRCAASSRTSRGARHGAPRKVSISLCMIVQATRRRCSRTASPRARPASTR